MTVLDPLLVRYRHNLQYALGYPQNTHFNYDSLIPALSYPINNYGDPFLLQNPVSSHEYECEVIRWFLRLLGLNDDLGWGYVTTGGTEGILFGIWQAKENLQHPVLYFSNYAHYAVIKSARITGVDYRIIDTTATGEMDYADFEQKLERERDAIVIATLGNTITSALDNVKHIRAITQKHSIKTYVHADAALDGMILPFIQNTSVPFGLKEGIDSLSISGHKLIGAPMPCGVVLIHKKYIEHTYTTVDYLNNRDCTVMGSRSGFAALILWEAIAKHKEAGFKALVEGYIAYAQQVTDLLNANDITAWRLPHAITIVLKLLPADIVKKWRAPSNHTYTTLTAYKLTESQLKEFIKDMHYYRKHQALVEPHGIIMPQIRPQIVLD